MKDIQNAASMTQHPDRFRAAKYSATKKFELFILISQLFSLIFKINKQIKILDKD